MIIFSHFIVNLTCFLQVLFQILDVKKNVTLYTKHVSKAGTVNQGDRVTLSPCKQALKISKVAKFSLCTDVPPPSEKNREKIFF